MQFVVPTGTSMIWNRVKRYLDVFFRNSNERRWVLSAVGLFLLRSHSSSSPASVWGGWKWSKGQQCFHGNNLSQHMCVCVFPLWCPFPVTDAQDSLNQARVSLETAVTVGVLAQVTLVILKCWCLYAQIKRNDNRRLQVNQRVTAALSSTLLLYSRSP